MTEVAELFRGIDHAQLHYATEVATRLVYEKHVRAGDAVIDCGASLGHHARELARIVGSTGLVHAFEPNPEHFCGLAALGSNLRLWPFAVGDALSVETLQIPVGMDGWASLVDRRSLLPGTPFVNRTTVQVRVDDLAEVAQRGIRFVKIDVEQRELQALEGMAGLLRRDRPLVVLEKGTEEIRALGQTVGYELLDFFGRTLDPADSVLANCVLLPGELSGAARRDVLPTDAELRHLYERTLARAWEGAAQHALRAWQRWRLRARGALRVR